tara:strand:- start:1289 stop:1816 length:528 start_codon:yes stop_codon:yes gene_type:complete
VPKQHRAKNSKSYIINEDIRYPKVRLVDHGIVDNRQAKQLALQEGLDLVCISATAQPPVCKIIDFNKWQFAEAQKLKEQQKRQRANRIETKEFQFRLSIDKHDKDVKIKNIWKHLDKGSHIRCILQLRGRERANIPYAREVFDSILEDIETQTVLEHVAPVSQAGNKIIAIVKRG